MEIKHILKDGTPVEDISKVAVPKAIIKKIEKKIEKKVEKNEAD